MADEAKPIVERIAERRAEIFHERRERLRAEHKRTMPRPQVEQLDGRWWRLTADYVVGPVIEGGPPILIRAGFIFDGASVPRLGWFYVTPSGEAFRASIPHDWRFRNHLPDDRAFVDWEWRHNLLDSGVRASEAWFLWAVLRAFGWWAWRNWKKRQAEVAKLAAELGLDGAIDG